LQLQLLLKTSNIFEGASIIYWDGGEGYVQIAGIWSPAPAAPVTSLKIEAAHILDASGGGKNEANIIISVPYKDGYIPVAYFTTSPDGLTYTRILLSGLPPSSPTNSLLVSGSDLTVERHGNQIAVESKGHKGLKLSHHEQSHRLSLARS
jgi:hypothetical protein